MPESHARRRDALRELLRAREVDAALVTDLLNVRYLTGFTGSHAALLVPAGDGRASIKAITGASVNVCLIRITES